MKDPEPIALFDLDGTLADYDKKINDDYVRISSPGEPPYNPAKKDQPKYMRERVRMIRRQPGWWESLEKFQLGFDVLRAAIDLKFENYILTKGPRSSPNAWTEKVKWVVKNVKPLDSKVQTIITEDKGVIYGRILVDDWPEYVERWLEHRPRGLVIMPAHPWNEGFRHPNVVRYNGSNLEEVVKRMTYARRR